LTEPIAPSAPSAYATAGAIGLCVVLGGALRLVAAQGDLWLDEIASIAAARELTSALGVFSLAQDNNHHLNTLWLYFVRDVGGSLAPRLLSIAAGTVAIALAALAFPARRPWARIVAALLVAISFPLVTYASEARGYAPMLCCGFAALVLLRRALAELGLVEAIAFGVVCVLGFLSHLSFAIFYVALLACSCHIVATRRLGVARSARALWRLHALPAAFLVVFYSVSLRDIAVLGAPPRSLATTLGEVAALALGWPLSPWLLLSAAVVVAALFVVALVSEWRASSDLWVFHLFAIVLVPALLLLLRPPEFAYPRYFLAPLAALLLLLASLLGRWVARGGAARGLAIGVCGALLIGNAVEVGRFLGPQRGAYRAAVTAMRASDATGPIRYGSDHPYRNGTLVAFYSAQDLNGTAFEYADKPEWESAGPPAWYLRHSFDRAPETNRYHLLRERYLYRFVDHYPYYGLSGWHWLLYRYERELPPEEAQRLMRKR
jgi:hypothetical protein